ncbi:OLC1v1030848C1 [Oldenlandia corymbosa var. corymbosa]|uniref:OLC1v1030848C1 n=1 Tax=Oldenlandia corymbosa var. corymbosa TaxID=529605 RepID=A0AAV1CH10_OLDCO|nr:OLC1v1030848C1 [Oldenlandia corymbosa var. corymbosa]
MIVSDVALEAFPTDYFRAQAERNNTQMYGNELREMFPETMRANGHKNRRCTRLTTVFLNRTRSYYAFIEEERVNDDFRITMNGDQGFHAMDIDLSPSDDDEDHNDDQNDEEENHEDPDGPEGSDNGPPDDGQEEDQEDMEVEHRFGNGFLNDGGPQENGFHEGSAASSPLGSAAKGNSPNSVLSFPSFNVLPRDMLPNHSMLELTQENFSPLSNLISTEDQLQETNGLENFVGVVSNVDPSVLVNSQIPRNSNVLSVEEHSADVPSPGIGDLNTIAEDRELIADQDTLFDMENELVVKEVEAESLVAPQMEEAEAQYQLEEQAAQYFSRLLVAGDEINSMEKAIILSWPQLGERTEKKVIGITEHRHDSSSKRQGKGIQEAKTLVGRNFKWQGMSFMARKAQQKRGRQMLLYQKELRIKGTLATDQSLTVPNYQPHRTLERLKKWKRLMAKENMIVRSDVLVGNEAKETTTVIKRPREVTEEE